METNEPLVKLEYDSVRSMLMDTKIILVLDKSRNDEKI